MGNGNSNGSVGKVVVIGGGLAGMAAACHLADQGYAVVLVERRPFLGGRAFSFTDPDTGQEVDNGQHVFLGCCTSYIDFLKALGVSHNTYLPPRLEVPVLGPGGKRGVLRSSNLPAPFHVLPSILRYPYLSWRDKLRVIYGGLRIFLTNRHKNRENLENETFASWLRRHHQSGAAIARFWSLVILPTLNDDISDVSADMGLMVLQEGLLRSRSSASIGYARVGLSSLVSDATSSYLCTRGGEVALGTRAEGLRLDGDRVRGVETSAGLVEGDWYIVALPPRDMVALLPPALAADPFFGRVQGLSSSPIVDVHLWYDRPIMEDVFCGFVDSPVQWVFNKTRMQGHNGASGQYLCISLSGAWRYADMPKSHIQEIFVQEMARLFPAAREATLERIIIVKQLQATFRSVPGVGSHRLPSTTPLSNLFIAGEWIETGWPGTMESAVRSGHMAAEALLSRRWQG
ncbi:MAG: FAD-dependent oxidoreductase [Chloroflexi bacterium]|nr:FAD-dependent oxidoreductase [Chloroflexota bacterium]